MPIMKVAAKAAPKTVKPKAEIDGVPIAFQNCAMDVTEEGILTIKVDLNNQLHASSSGKNMIIATTQGNKQIPGAEHVTIGLNIYTKPE